MGLTIAVDVFEQVDQHVAAVRIKTGLHNTVMLKDQSAVRRSRAARLGEVLAHIAEFVHPKTLGVSQPLNLILAFKLHRKKEGLINGAFPGGRGSENGHRGSRRGFLADRSQRIVDGRGQACGITSFKVGIWDTVPIEVPFRATSRRPLGWVVRECNKARQRQGHQSGRRFVIWRTWKRARLPSHLWSVVVVLVLKPSPSRSRSHLIRSSWIAR